MAKSRWTADETKELQKLVEKSGKNDGVRKFLELHPDRTEDSVRSKLRSLDVKESGKPKKTETVKKEKYVKPETTVSEEINESETKPLEPWEEPVTDPYYMQDDDNIKESWFRRLLNWLRGNN